MTRSRLLNSLAAASFGALLLGACSTDALTERAAEFGLERAIEGNEDIDLDFGGNGGFSISTDEGDFSLNFDEENGGINFNGPDGEGAIRFDEDGIVFNTDEGDGVIAFDEENGAITFDTDEGSGAINFDDNGLTVQSEDGSTSGIYNSTDVPASWPAFLGRPDSVVPETESYTVFDFGDGSIVTTGVFEHAANEDYAGKVIAALAANGWDVTFSQTDGASGFHQLTAADGSTAQVVFDGASTTSVTLTTTA